MKFYQVVRHIQEIDGSITDVPTIDISTDKIAMEKIAKDDRLGLWNFINATKSVREISKEELEKFMARNLVTDKDLKIKIYPSES